MIRYECTALVFSKAPVPGTVKTRLSPAVNETDAAQIYKGLVERTLNMISAVDNLGVQLWCTPVIDHPFFLECREKYELDLYLQCGGNLGDRMQAAIKETLWGDNSVLVIGCDCPELQAEDLSTARDKLRSGYDVVLGPSEDGGYYLIGMKELNPEIFRGISWGGATVLGETRNRIAKMGLSCYELPVHWDVDDGDDLARYLSVRNNTEKQAGVDDTD